MIQLTNEEKQFIQEKLKPYLKTDNWEKIRQICSDKSKILCFLAEAGLDVFSGLTAVPTNMFAQSALTHITIPSYIDVIRDKAFFGCSDLTSVTFEDGVETIEKEAFAYSGLVQMKLPESVINIKPGAFKGCANLKQVIIPDSVTVLSPGIFEDCSDVIEIFANSRKNMPKRNKLKCNSEEVEWYMKHLKVLGE